MNAKFPIIVELSREDARRNQVERPDELAPEGVLATVLLARSAGNLPRRRGAAETEL
jgi:hypothetical protein